MTRPRGLMVVAAVAAAMGAGCGGGATVDTGQDSVADAHAGAEAGGGADAVADVLPDAAPDMVEDAGAQPDIGPDVGPDVGPDAGLDAGPDVPPTAPLNANSALATNLSGIRDWVPSWPFVDVFHTSRVWVSGDSDGTWDDGRPIDTDADGWVRSLLPGQVARTLMLWGGTHFPEGDYVVLYEGQGTLEYAMGASRDDGASAPGRDVVHFRSDKGGFLMNLTATDPSDPVRDVRVLMPGGVCHDDPLRACEEAAPCPTGACDAFEDVYDTQVFHPGFLAGLARFRALRFMDWMDTNDSTVSTYAQRPKPTDARWSTHGVPVELIVALCNRLSADAWVNIPHLADDDYVTQLATYLHDHLDPSLRVYVEHSNEVWNGQFAQAQYAQARGLELGLSSDPFQAQLRYHSLRSVQIFDLFEAVYGGTDRLVRVMAAQAANSWTSEQVLDYGDAPSHTDALAIAPYFGNYLGAPDQQPQVAAMSLDALFSELTDTAIPKSTQWMADQAAVASARGVALLAYEGGQHLVGVGPAQSDDAVNALFDAANRDPRMGALYTTYLQAWRDAGGQLFAHFTHVGGYSKYGRWGSLEYQDQPQGAAPKRQALMGFMDATPACW